MKIYLYLFCLVILFSGCSPSAMGTQFNSFSPSKQGFGTIYVYRPWDLAAGALQYSVHLTNEQNEDIIFGDLRNGSYISIKAPIGKNQVWASTEDKKSIFLDVKQDEIYCIKGSFGMGMWVARPYLELVDFDTCAVEIKTTKKPY